MTIASEFDALCESKSKELSLRVFYRCQIGLDNQPFLRRLELWESAGGKYYFDRFGKKPTTDKLNLTMSFTSFEAAKRFLLSWLMDIDHQIGKSRSVQKHIALKKAAAAFDAEYSSRRDSIARAINQYKELTVVQFDEAHGK